jgi:hypothetical protein
MKMRNRLPLLLLLGLLGLLGCSNETPCSDPLSDYGAACADYWAAVRTNVEAAPPAHVLGRVVVSIDPCLAPYADAIEGARQLMAEWAEISTSEGGLYMRCEALDPSAVALTRFGYGTVFNTYYFDQHMSAAQAVHVFAHEFGHLALNAGHTSVPGSLMNPWADDTLTITEADAAVFTAQAGYGAAP